jgi:hypothetical protein
MKKNAGKPVKFAVCLTGCEPDLEPRKIYRVVPDESAAKNHYLRVIDESGEDYLYPESYFVVIELPQAAERTLLGASS